MNKQTAEQLSAAAAALIEQARQLQDEAQAALVENNREFNGRTWALDAPGGRIVAKAELRKNPGSKPYVLVTIEGPPGHGPYLPTNIVNHFVAVIAESAPVRTFYVSVPFWGRQSCSRTPVCGPPCTRQLAIDAAYFSGALSQDDYDRHLRANWNKRKPAAVRPEKGGAR